MKIPKEIKATPWPEDFHGGNEHYRVLVSLPVIGGERLLVVTFLPNRDKAVGYGRTAAEAAKSFRLICSKRERRAVILYQNERQGKRHRLRKATHAMGADPRSMYPLLDQREEAALAKWLGAKDTTNHYLERLEAWADAALTAEAQAERDARGELRDEDVTLCPEELPEGLEDWVRREVLARDNTMLYKKGGFRGVCFLCGRPVRASGERFAQHKYVKCPDCGEKVLCVLSGGAAFGADYVGNIIAAQQGTDGKTVFFRQWHVKRDPNARYERVAPWLEEFGRYAVRGDRVAKWLREYKENHMMNAWRYRLEGWTRFQGVEIYDGGYHFFEGSVPAAVAGTRLRYADIPSYCREFRERHRDAGWGYRNTVRYAMDWARYPVLEFLWKAGYRKLVFERVAGLSKDCRNAIRWNRTVLKECFRFPLRVLKLKEPGEWSMADVQRAGELWELCRAGALAERDIPELLESGVNLSMLTAAAAYAPLMKIIRYLGDQTWAHRGALEQAYRDYIQECVQLRLNLHDKAVLFPRDLQEAHNRTMAQISFEKNKADQEKFAAQVRKLERLAWERDGLLIRPARTQEELSAEGAALSHCVGGYIGRMAGGDTAIFFIRKKSDPDKPYFTLEYRSGAVIQCRTKNNKGYEQVPEVKAFAAAWLDWVKAGAKRDKRGRPSLPKKKEAGVA